MANTDNIYLQLAENTERIFQLKCENKKLKDEINILEIKLKVFEKTMIRKKYPIGNFTCFANGALIFFRDNICVDEDTKSVINSLLHKIGNWDECEHQKGYCKILLLAFEEWEKKGFPNERKHMINVYKFMMDELREWLKDAY